MLVKFQTTDRVAGTVCNSTIYDTLFYRRDFDMLETGIAAPDFKLMDKNGNPVSYLIFGGKSCRLFLSKEDTPDVFAKHAHFAMHMTASKRRY
jgi:hypothetical protein